jgi:hypothetical protein
MIDTQDVVNDLLSADDERERRITAETAARAGARNVSLLAFTATPKDKTKRLFGRSGDDGKPASFDVYTMRQAIEDGFILDVLRGYQMYKTAFEIEQRGHDGVVTTITSDDERLVDPKVATRAIMRFKNLHPPTSGRWWRSSLSTSGSMSLICSTVRPRRWSSPTRARPRCGTRSRPTPTLCREPPVPEREDRRVRPVAGGGWDDQSSGVRSARAEYSWDDTWSGTGRAGIWPVRGAEAGLTVMGCKTVGFLVVRCPHVLIGTRVFLEPRRRQRRAGSRPGRFSDRRSWSPDLP